MIPPSKISAEPYKDFFISMLTRDIALDDAILDLIDNALDGVVREIGKSGLKRKDPYKSYNVEVTIGPDKFSVRDNCGGIPPSRYNYAFRMGRPEHDPDRKLPTVGTYGIGMKRAIFKIGTKATVESRHNDGALRVHFEPSFRQTSSWELPSDRKVGFRKPGTRIVVSTLSADSAEMFANKEFQRQLRRKISIYYATIIDKGFSISINGEPVAGYPIVLRFSDRKKGGIRPYIFTQKKDGVEVFLAVGFTRPIPDVDESAEQEAGGVPRYTQLDAGWTIACNDRIILYCDKTELTGWGEAGVPRYHNQFIAISGYVSFSSDDASRLPMTTTKSGIDGSSRLYLQTKNKMREGLKLFTSYTNEWKGRELAPQGKKHIEQARSMSIREIQGKVPSLRLNRAINLEGAKQYRPALPSPKSGRSSSGAMQVCFAANSEEVERVGLFVLGTRRASASRIGRLAFDRALDEARIAGVDQ